MEKNADRQSASTRERENRWKIVRASLRGEPHLFAYHYLSQGRKREIAKRVIHVRFGEASRRSAIADERNEAEEHNRRLLVHFPISCRDKLAIVKLGGWRWFPSRLQFNGRLSSLSMAMIVRWTITTMAC